MRALITSTLKVHLMTQKHFSAAEPWLPTLSSQAFMLFIPFSHLLLPLPVVPCIFPINLIFKVKSELSFGLVYFKSPTFGDEKVQFCLFSNMWRVSLRHTSPLSSSNHLKDCKHNYFTTIGSPFQGIPVPVFSIMLFLLFLI